MGWTHEELYFSAPSYFESLIAGLRAARESIELESYIFERDEIGEKVIWELVAARQRGVNIRVIVDGVGSPDWGNGFGRILTEADVPSAIFHPVKSLFVSLLSRSRFLRLNKRDHRKLCIVDGRKMWIGSFNVISKSWRDTGALLEGDHVDVARHAFRRTWRRSKKLIRKNPAVSDSDVPFRVIAKESGLKGGIRLNDRKSLRKAQYRELLELVRTAKKHLWITNPYFIPPYRFQIALKQAAHRGVDVRVIIPYRSDVRIVDWVGSLFHLGLLKSHVRIFRYIPTILHAKTMIIDEIALVGSSNLNRRSFRHDLEIDVVLRQSASLQQLREQFLEDQRVCKERTVASFHNRPFTERVFGWLLYFGRHWM